MIRPCPILKPAAFLTLGASAIFGCSAAKALTTYSLYYSSTSSNSLSGSLTIDENLASTTSFYNSPPSWLTALSLTQTVAGASTTYQLSDYGIFRWAPNSSSIDFNSDLVPQFTDINFFRSNPGSSAPSGVGRFQMSPPSSSERFTMTSATPVPGPLPILGLPAVLLYTRKLKKRIKARREISSTSLA